MANKIPQLSTIQLPVSSLTFEVFRVITAISFILFNNLQRFLGEIETDNLTVSNNDIITLDFTVSKERVFME